MKSLEPVLGYDHHHPNNKNEKRREAVLRLTPKTRKRKEGEKKTIREKERKRERGKRQREGNFCPQASSSLSCASRSYSKNT